MRHTIVTYMASKLTKLVHHHTLHQQTRVHVHNSVKIFVGIMALFRLRIFVIFFVPISFFKTNTDIALKLTTLFHHHYLHQQTRVHSSVKNFVRIMALFRLRILVKFFVPIYLFSKPLQIWLRNLQNLFTIITSSNRH